MLVSAVTYQLSPSATRLTVTTVNQYMHAPLIPVQFVSLLMLVLFTSNVVLWTAQMQQRTLIFPPDDESKVLVETFLI